MTESYQRTANLLGALALAVADLTREATEGPADGLAAPEPAALVTLARYPGQSVLRLRPSPGTSRSSRSGWPSATRWAAWSARGWGPGASFLVAGATGLAGALIGVLALGRLGDPDAAQSLS